jgi:FkbM family methyltransferase
MPKEFQVNIKDYALTNSLAEIQLHRILKYSRRRVLSVIHIGGFDGSFDIDLAGKFRRIEIHTIEACPKNFKHLSRRIKANDKIQAYKLAITNYSGSMDFYLYLRESLKDKKLSSQSNSTFPEFLSGKEKERVKKIKIPCRMLDHFCDAAMGHDIQRIDLLRINCEGAEYKIFHPQSDCDFLKKTNIIHIFMHGKSLSFVNKKRMQGRSVINKRFKQEGFELLYGHDLTQADKFPAGHVQQIWIRKEWI